MKVAAPATESSNDAANQARINRGLNNALNQQGGTVTLRLTPPEMGTVRIQLQLQGASVSAQFHAETESARSLLTQQLGQLRSTLEASGLNVDKLGVQAMGGSGASGLNTQSDSSSDQSSRDPSDGRSRGRFGQPSQQQNPEHGSESNAGAFGDLIDASEDQ